MVAICFYTFDSYNELKIAAEDKDALCNSYSDWLAEFTKTVMELKGQGLEAIPVNINIGELSKWCTKNKLKNSYLAFLSESVLLHEQKSSFPKEFPNLLRTCFGHTLLTP